MTWRGRTTALKLTIEDFVRYLDGLTFRDWKPSGMVLHNTASPSNAVWQKHPGEVWLHNLREFYENEQHWSAGPHLFIGWDEATQRVIIWVMTDLNVRGTHSPSYNGSRLGVEMVADFSVEDDEAGWGLKVKQTTAHVFAIVHAKMGWDPESIKLHKEDPATTHDCPGRHIEKRDFLNLVAQYMGDAGEHPPDWSGVVTGAAPAAVTARHGVVAVPAGETLNLRSSASQGSAVVAALIQGAALSIVGEQKNGATIWYRVDALAIHKSGWVAGRYVSFG